MKRKIKSLVALLMALLTAVIFLFAAPAASAVGPFIAIYEHADSTGSHVTVSTAKADLSNFTTGLNVFACGAWQGNTEWDWNNCISVVWASLPSNRCVVLYDGLFYTGATYRIHGPRNNVNFQLHLAGWGDRVGSFRFGTLSGGVCTSPWT